MDLLVRAPLRAPCKVVPLFSWSCLVYICYLPAGRSVLGKTVPEVLSTARGRRPRSVLKTVEYFVSSFCVEFSLQPFSNLGYAWVWHLGNKKFNVTFFCISLFLRSLFTFNVLSSEKKKTAGKDAKAGKLVAVRTGGPDGKIRTARARAMSQSNSRI